VHLSHVLLVSGAVPESASPCGSNCTYTVEFEGPAFQCNTTIQNQTSEAPPGPVEYIDPVTNETYLILTSQESEGTDHYSGAWSNWYSQWFTSEAFVMNLTQVLGSGSGLLLQEVQTLECEPAFATYEVHLEYKDGLRSFSYNKTEGERLSDTFVRRTAPNRTAEGGVSWNADQVRNLKNINYYGVLDAVAKALTGSYQQYARKTDNPVFSYRFPNGTNWEFSPTKGSFAMSREAGFRVQQLSDESSEIRELLRWNPQMEDARTGLTGHRT
jgi:hypothetical protein